MGLL
jgi:hypothetical protein